MKTKIIIQIQTNPNNNDLLDVSIRRVGRIPRAMQQAIMSVYMAVSDAVRQSFSQIYKQKESTDGSTDTNGEQAGGDISDNA